LSLLLPHFFFFFFFKLPWEYNKKSWNRRGNGIWKMLFILYPHNTGTTTPHMGWASQCVELTPYEGLLYHCCVGVVHQSSPMGYISSLNFFFFHIVKWEMLHIFSSANFFDVTMKIIIKYCIHFYSTMIFTVTLKKEKKKKRKDKVSS
jgi:hypothetical protein